MTKSEIKLFNKQNLKYNCDNKLEKKINLCISNICFVKCAGCYNNFCKDSLVNCDKLIRFLKYAKSKGLTKITLSGGDPLARTDIKQIISSCLKLGLEINLDTVGYTFLEDTKIFGSDVIIKRFDNIAILKSISSIGIPIDGSNQKIISEFRISDGNLFNILINLLNYFEKLNIKICINTVVHKKNINDIINIYKIISKYKCIKKWQLFQFMPLGDLGYKNRVQFEITKDEFKKCYDELFKIAKCDFEIEFKSAEERSYNYMLVNSEGTVYKVDLNNNIKVYGSILNNKTWDNILDNLY